jgi:hypothetical protein
MTHAELFKACGRSIQAWAMELSRRLDPESAGKLLIAGAVPVLQAVYGKQGAVDFLRTLADELERDEPVKPN